MFFYSIKQTNIFQFLLILIFMAFAFQAGTAVADDSPFDDQIVLNEIYEHQHNGFVEIKVKQSALFATPLNLYVEICSGPTNKTSFGCSAQMAILNDEIYPTIDVIGSNASFLNTKDGFVITLYDSNHLVVDRIIANGYSYVGMPVYSATSQISTKNGSKVIRRLPDGSKDIGSGIDVDVDVISSNSSGERTRGSSNDGEVATYYKLLFNPQNITCESLNVEVRACVGVNDCSSLPPIDVNAVLQVQTSSGNTFDVTIDGSGIGNAQVFHNSVETVSLSLVNEAYECDPADCNVEFVQSILKLTPVNEPNNLNTACGLVRNFTLQALQADESNQCISQFVDSTKALTITSSLPNLLFNGADIDQSPIDVDFNGSGDAIVTIAYNDAGQHDTNFSITETLPGAGELVISGSAQLGFYPDYFDITGLHSDNSVITDTSPEVAGNDFNFNIEAMCTNDTTATNYQASTDTVTMTLTQGVDDLVLGKFSLPSATNPTVITDSNPQEVYTPFIDGKYSNTQAQYLEVGQISIKVEDNYLGQDISTSKILSRFIPDHFELAVEQTGSLESASCDAFTYTGKLFNSAGDITYDELPQIKISPFSKVSGGSKSITQNYLLKNQTSNYSISTSASNQHTLGRNGMFLQLDNQINISTNFSLDNANPGVNYYRFNPADHFNFVRTQDSMINTFAVHIELLVSSFTDDDLVDFSQCGASEVSCTCTSGTCQLTFDLSGLDNSFARWKILDTFGPETENLGQIMKVQHYTESASGVADWLINDSDSCTEFLDSSLTVVDINDLDVNLTSVLNSDASVVTFINGAVRTLLLSAPGETGKVGLNYDVPNWFKYDWLQNGALDQNPSAIATFGRFNKVSKRVISQREIERKN
ncbi:hypothetical protein RGQ13_02730 [Thalassotalea psychrophila]|uniref:DUF6701 domain-containing protein n=1 Tax=Thalassotalea psychrophila TaxID=3065647 RepID=A0ABY9TWL8_9GAMM|nr:hypothetical protein RGQ13_02730 [Colwelliaceae bacterium SQ149]